MEFLNPFHRKRYLDLVAKAQLIDDDVERQVLFFCLSSNLLYGKVYTLYDFKKTMINPEGLKGLEVDERALAELAFNLYNRFPTKLTVADIFNLLDDENAKIAIDAIRLRFFGSSLA